MKKFLMVLVVGMLLGPAANADRSLDRILAGLFGLSTASSIFTTDRRKKKTTYLQQQEFVAVTLDNLSEQIALGGGPNLQSLAALLGCPASDYSALTSMARRNFGRLFPTTEIEPGEFLARLKYDIAHDPRLSASCAYV